MTSLFLKCNRRLYSKLFSSKISSARNFNSNNNESSSQFSTSSNSDRSTTNHASDDTKNSEFERFKSTLNAEDRRKLENYAVEFELFRHYDSRMPSKLETAHWQRLLEMSTKSMRIRYLTHLYEREGFKYHRRIKRERSGEIIENARDEIQRIKSEHIYYGLGGWCLFRRFMEADMKRSLNSKLCRAISHGPSVIFDMSLIPSQKHVEVIQTSRQFVIAYNENRQRRFPHHLILSDCDRRHASWRLIERHILNGGIDSALCTVSSENYARLYDRDRLIYLTSAAKRTMYEYDPDKVYVIGASPHWLTNSPARLGRAKEYGVEARRLPVERCMRWARPRPINLIEVMQILNEAHETGSLTTAIASTLPLRQFRDLAEIERYRDSKEFETQREDALRRIAFHQH